jgi:hypothetical protein
MSSAASWPVQCQAHGASDAARRFEAIYGPGLVAGPVVFTGYLQIATNH